MAGKTATKSKAKKAPAKAPAPAPEPDELELEEVDGEEVEETGGKKGGSQDEVTFGASDLAKHLSQESGKNVTPRELRTLIRKMARDGSGRVTREITPGNRTRYNWSGLDDPEVQKIIAAYNGGELEADKQAKLAELKANKAAKKAAKGDDKAGKGKAKGKKAKKAEPEPVEDEVDDDDELELDDDE